MRGGPWCFPYLDTCEYAKTHKKKLVTSKTPGIDNFWCLKFLMMPVGILEINKFDASTIKINGGASMGLVCIIHFFWTSPQKSRKTMAWKNSGVYKKVGEGVIWGKTKAVRCQRHGEWTFYGSKRPSGWGKRKCGRTGIRTDGYHMTALQKAQKWPFDRIYLDLISLF